MLYVGTFEVLYRTTVGHQIHILLVLLCYLWSCPGLLCLQKMLNGLKEEFFQDDAPQLRHASAGLWGGNPAQAG